MASNVDDLEKALRTGLVECISPLPLAGDNLEFKKPVDGAPWAAFHIMSNVPSAATYGSGGQDAHDGIMQVDLYFPKLKGTKDVSAAARKVTDYFHVGRVLLSGETRVHVAGSGGARNNPDKDGYYCRSLTISWWARIDRPA